jgi:hypothetical protein
MVFVVLFTAAHYAAVWAATQLYRNASDMPGIVGGAVGGALGAAIAFAGCAAWKLFREGSATLVFAAFGVVLLGAVGSFGVYMYVTSGAGPDSFASDFGRLLWIYVPWQLTFAYILSKTLKPVGD